MQSKLKVWSKIKCNTLHIIQINTYIQWKQFTACGNHIQHFYIVARLQAMATLRIRFSLPKTIFTVGMEEVGLANTGSNRKHSKTWDINSNEYWRATHCSGRNKRKKERWHLRPGDNLSPHRCMWYKISLIKTIISISTCTCVIKYNSYIDFLTDSLATIHVSTIQHVLTRAHVKEHVVTLKFLRFIDHQNIERKSEPDLVCLI